MAMTEPKGKGRSPIQSHSLYYPQPNKVGGFLFCIFAVGKLRMNEENAKFNGNLALLRVCAIMLIAGALQKSIGLSWTLLMSEANDDTLGWAYVPFGLLVAVFGVISLVKKNTLILKIYAVLMLVSMVVGTIGFVRHGLNFSAYYRTGYIVWSAIGHFVNINTVMMAASFLIDSKKRINEDVYIAKNENMGLLRFCAAVFLVDGLNTVTDILAAGEFKAFLGMSVLWTFVPIAMGLYALLKKNSLVLMVYSVIAFVATVWNTILDAQESFITAFYVGNIVIGFLFNSFFVVCVATFFIEPELTRTYFNKVKSLLLSQSK